MRLELRLEHRIDQSQGGTGHQNLADAPGLSTEAAQALDEASHMFPWAREHVFNGWHEPREQRRDDQGAEPPLNNDGRLRQPVWNSKFGRPTPSTRRRPHNCIRSMAWRFYAIDATLSP